MKGRGRAAFWFILSSRSVSMRTMFVSHWRGYGSSCRVLSDFPSAILRPFFRPNHIHCCCSTVCVCVCLFIFMSIGANAFRMPLIVSGWYVWMV